MKPTKVIAHRDHSDVARHTTAAHGCNAPLWWRFERSWRGGELLVARCSHCGAFAGTVCFVIEFTAALNEPQSLEGWPDRDEDEDTDEDVRHW